MSNVMNNVLILILTSLFVSIVSYRIGRRVGAMKQIKFFIANPHMAQLGADLFAKRKSTDKTDKQ